jgi:hypothetical protein
MGRRSRGTYAAVAALTAITVGGLGVPAHAAEPTVVRIADYRTSAHPAGVAWLDGRVLHTAQGDTRPMPWSRAAAKNRSLRILGHTARGWLLKDFSDSAWNVWLVRGGERTRLSSTDVSEGDLVTIVTSTDHHRYAVSDFDGDATATVSVHNLRGRTLAGRTFAGDGAVLDLSGPEAVVGTTDTQRWLFDDPAHPGDGSVTDLGVDAVGASLSHDLVLVRDSQSGQVGPTSLSDPGTPTWTAAMTDPRFSPAGGRVVSRTQARSQVLEIHRVSDGALLRSFQVRYLAGETPLWADNHRFAFIGSTTGLGDRERLATCTVAGLCSAHSAVRPRDRLSIPPL